MVEYILIDKYRNMFGVDNIQILTGNTLLKGVTFCSDLNIGGDTYIVGNVTNMSNMNIQQSFSSNNCTVQNTLNIKDTLSTFNNITVNNQIYSQDNLNISGSAYINNLLQNGNISIGGNLYLNNSCFIDTDLTTPFVGADASTFIYGNTINIGSTNSIVNILGNSTYVASNNMFIQDPIYSLNINGSTLSAFDIGDMSGLLIASTGQTGFIRTTIDATRFELQAPQNPASYYILTQDLNNNLSISGNAVLYNNITGLSSLYNQGALITSNLIQTLPININDSVLCNNLTGLSSLYIKSSCTILNNITSNSKINVLGACYANELYTNNITVNSITNIGNTTIKSSLLVSGNSLFYGTVTMQSGLQGSNALNINGSVSVGSNLIVYGACSVNSNFTSNNIIVSNDSMYNSDTTIMSSLNVSLNTILNGGLVVNTNNLVKINAQILCPLIEYSTNTEAKNNGLSIGGLYRTGGIIKYVVNDTPPILTLSGSSNITISGTYVEPGVVVTSPYDDIIVYVTSISFNGGNNLLQNAVTLNQVSNYIITSDVGTYSLVYGATDIDGNVAMPISRTLTITSLLTSKRLTSQGFENLYIPERTVMGIGGIFQFNNLYCVWPVSYGDNPTRSAKALRLYTSPNKLNWTEISTNLSQAANNTVRGFNTIVTNSTCAVGLVSYWDYNNLPGVYRSVDLTNWTLVISMVGFQELSIANNIFFAVGNSTTGFMMYSLDGITWVNTTLPTMYTGGNIGYLNNTYVFVGRNTIATSSNLSTWTYININTITPVVPDSTDYRNCIAYKGSFYILPYWSDTNWRTMITLKSTDGINWSTNAPITFHQNATTASVNGVVFMPQRPIILRNRIYCLLAYSAHPTFGVGMMFTSTSNGTTWVSSSDIIAMNNTLLYGGMRQPLPDNTLTLTMYSSGDRGVIPVASQFTVNGVYQPFLEF